MWKLFLPQNKLPQFQKNMQFEVEPNDSYNFKYEDWLGSRLKLYMLSVCIICPLWLYLFVIHTLIVGAYQYKT
jgi:hypothetical protein